MNVQRSFEIRESDSRKAFDKENPFDLASFSNDAVKLPHLDVSQYARENPQKFLKMISSLSPKRRQMAVEHILLRKTEQQIATIHGRKSQSMLGQELKSIVREIGVRMRLGGAASNKPAPAELLACDRLQKALIEYRELTAKKRRRPRRMSPRRVFRDPSWLGSFEIRLKRRGINAMFTSRAGQVSNRCAIREQCS